MISYWARLIAGKHNKLSFILHGKEFDLIKVYLANSQRLWKTYLMAESVM